MNKFFPLPQRPAYADKLKFPADITELTSANISELMGKYTEMYSYAAAEAAKAEVQLLLAETEERKTETRILNSRPNIVHLEKWRKDLVVDSDKTMLKLHEQVKKAQVRLRYAKMYLEIFDRYLNALSRELTRKTNDTQQSVGSLKRLDKLKYNTR